VPTINPTLQETESRITVATWELATGDDGAPIRYAGAADRTVQVFGTFGGATIGMQGSLDGINWAPLTDAQGNAIAMTAAGLEAITELVRFTRPVVTGGSGTSVTVMLLMRQTI